MFGHRCDHLFLITFPSIAGYCKSEGNPGATRGWVVGLTRSPDSGNVLSSAEASRRL